MKRLAIFTAALACLACLATEARAQYAVARQRSFSVGVGVGGYGGMGVGVGFRATRFAGVGAGYGYVRPAAFAPAYYPRPALLAAPSYAAFAAAPAYQQSYSRQSFSYSQQAAFAAAPPAYCPPPVVAAPAPCATCPPPVALPGYGGVGAVGGCRSRAALGYGAGGY